MGEEEFYIDNITNLFIEDVLTDEEKQFNLKYIVWKGNISRSNNIYL